ncbi:hypothetical protein OpiT1DRAFT_04684 [Opitutaceae bacterium TAV1]|nr:hypothetical protein OpiT1DRAFT_04684 [Opitutaceae bacterium TAV1]
MTAANHTATRSAVADDEGFVCGFREGKSGETVTKVLDNGGVALSVNPQPAARSPQPAARSPQPAARSPQPAARSPQPAARSPQPAAR